MLMDSPFKKIFKLKSLCFRLRCFFILLCVRSWVRAGVCECMCVCGECREDPVDSRAGVPHLSTPRHRVIHPPRVWQWRLTPCSACPPANSLIWMYSTRKEQTIFWRVNQLCCLLKSPGNPQMRKSLESEKCCPSGRWWSRFHRRGGRCPL